MNASRTVCRATKGGILRKGTVKKVAPKKVAPKRAPVKKAAPKRAPVKKVAPKRAVKKGSSSRGGWLGAETGYRLDNWYGSGRKLYLPGGFMAADEIPRYLDGSLAGDYGYDPLGLGKDAAQVEEYRKFELIHARWAMVAILGCLIPEAADQFGDGTQIIGPVWWQTGAEMLDGSFLKWYGITVPLPLILVAGAEVALMGAVEKYRSDNAGPAGEDLDPLYPGGAFDPLGLADDPDAFAELKVKEIKNGRLALVSMLGFAVQAAVTKEGPFANWSQHVSDPFGYNILSVIGNTERVPSL